LLANGLRYLRVDGREYGEGEEHSSFPHCYLLYSPPKSAQQKNALQKWRVFSIDNQLVNSLAHHLPEFTTKGSPVGTHIKSCPDRHHRCGYYAWPSRPACRIFYYFLPSSNSHHPEIDL